MCKIKKQMEVQEDKINHHLKQLTNLNMMVFVNEGKIDQYESKMADIKLGINCPVDTQHKNAQFASYRVGVEITKKEIDNLNRKRAKASKLLKIANKEYKRLSKKYKTMPNRR